WRAFGSSIGRPPSFVFVQNLFEPIEELADVGTMLADVEPFDGDVTFATDVQITLFDVNDEFGAPAEKKEIEPSGYRRANAPAAVAARIPAEFVEGFLGGMHEFFARGAL